MIPNIDDLQPDFVEVEEKTLTFGLDKLESNPKNIDERDYLTKIKLTKPIVQNGKTVMIDDLEALTQHIYFMLNIEAGQFLIYGDDVGIETIDLFGKPTSYVVAVLESRIEQALSQDERIESIDNFEYEVDHGKIHLTFTVKSIYGDIDSETVVAL